MNQRVLVDCMKTEPPRTPCLDGANSNAKAKEARLRADSFTLILQASCPQAADKRRGKGRDCLARSSSQECRTVTKSRAITPKRGDITRCAPYFFEIISDE